MDFEELVEHQVALNWIVRITCNSSAFKHSLAQVVNVRENVQIFTHKCGEKVEGRSEFTQTFIAKSCLV